MYADSLQVSNSLLRFFLSKACNSANSIMLIGIKSLPWTTFCKKQRGMCCSMSRINPRAVITVSIHGAPEISEIDCISRIESFWHKFVRGW